MKRISHILITLALFALLIGCLSLTALAVPPAPGSGWEKGTACRSCAADKLVTLDSLPASRSASEPRCAPAADGQKTIPLLTLVIGFSDMPYETGFDWNASVFSGSRSLEAYYTDMSLGQFTFTPIAETSAYGVGGNGNTADRANDGVVHVTLDMPHGDWTLEYADSATDYAENHAMVKAFADAVTAADDYVDFAAYDRSGDGVITTDEMALAFVVAGWEAAYDNALTMGANYYIWSHAWDLVSGCYFYGGSEVKVPKPDGIMVSNYIAIAERLQEDEQEPICVLAHELGHYLGLPDLYDTGYSTSSAWSDYDVSYLSVMCSGSWGYDLVDGDYIYVPFSFDIWSKVMLGWVTPVTAENDASYTLAAGGALKIGTGRADEYYLVENRRFTGWDAGMALEYDGTSDGLVIWHIDDGVYQNYVGGNTVNNTNHRPAVMPLYPETVGKTYTYIGDTDGVLLDRPFYDQTVWQGGPGISLGKSLDLPLYGAGSNADKRASRTLSGVRLTFTCDTADVMTLMIGDPAGAEEHTLEPVPEAPATCVDPGVRAHYVCTDCGKRFLDSAGTIEASDEDLVLPPTGVHTYETWTVVSAPTCTEAGSETSVCAVCGAGTARAVDPLDHDYVDHEAQTPNCTYPGWDAYQTCSRCDYTTYKEIPRDPNAHVFNVTVYEPTCVDEGYTSYACKYCRYGYSDDITDPLGHNYVYHDGSAPTCVSAGWADYRTCARCDYTDYTELPADPDAHSLSGAGYEANCTEAGYTVFTCEYCGYSYTTDYAAPLGHDYVDHEAEAPTCTAPGSYAYRTCSRCDYTTYEEIPALGHDYVDHAAQEPTCTKPGWDAYQTCSRCDYTSYEEIPLLGHDYVDHDAQAPNCTYPGWYAYQTCARCDYSTYKEIPRDPNAHVFNVTVYEPTCVDEGYTSYACKYCRYGYSDDIVKPLGHDYVDHAAQEPTCTEPGWNAYQTCSRCEYTTYAEIPATGRHTFGDWIVTTEPTCVNKGVETRTCTVCKTAAETREVKATGIHSYGEWTVTTPATTEKDGEETRTCPVCGVTETRVIPKLQGPDDPDNPDDPTLDIGDIDRDGNVTAADARLALRAAVGLETFTPAETDLADADRDGRITAADARMILRAAVGLEDRREWLKKT